MLSLCNEWEFTSQWYDGFAAGMGTGTPVRLPHSVAPLPLHHADPARWQMVCGYRRRLELGPELAGKVLLLRFEGAAHTATVYLNGQALHTHRCGYTAFRVDITDAAVPGGENLLAVKLDTAQDPAIPPFGGAVDGPAPGGLYRQVWLEVREKTYIDDLYITTPDLATLKIRPTLVGARKCMVVVELLKGGQQLLRKAFTVDGVITIHCPGVRPWEPEHPVLYTCRVSLVKIGQVLDEQEVRVGFRTAQFKADGFYLNGRKTFLRGLNRLQSYPHIGWAAPERLQREDARILKEELGCNAVRTAYGPPSRHFIEECDRLGLLVFTEIPGCRHIGGEEWQRQAAENTRALVRQYRSHPSVILWGVRISGSADNAELYRLTTGVANLLDTSRATTGARDLEKSDLLEDVYAYNDDSHTGDNPGCRAKKAVTPEPGKAYLISEHTGRGFPARAWDPWQLRQEQALRHARVLNDAAAAGDIAGCFGWCMADYPTGPEFGAGDRLCSHGVLDAFRNPKLAAALYASQAGGGPVLELGAAPSPGENPDGRLRPVAVFTNAETVALYRDGRFVTELTRPEWKGLAHGPMLLDDPIGCLPETREGFDKQGAERLRACLLAMGRQGIGSLTPADRAKMGYALRKCGLRFEDAAALYDRYLGRDSAAAQWRLDAEVGGQVVASRTCAPGARLRLELRPSHTELTEGDTYDLAALRVRVLDEYGNPAPWAQVPVRFCLEGPAELVGPEVVTAEGGMTGTFLRTVGRSGEARLTVSAEGMDSATFIFHIN